MKRRLGSHGELADKLTAGDWVIALNGRYLPFRFGRAAVDPYIVLEIAFSDLPAVLVERVRWRPGQRLWLGVIAGERTFAYVERAGATLTVGCRGGWQKAQLMTARTAALAALMPEKGEAGHSKAVLCPMPGLVVSVMVREGQVVEAGESLAVVEAMKMENVLRAERAGEIGRIHVKPGDSLAVDAVMMEFA
jgi:propionyl-CoA carboxylase alpha chain